MEEVVSSNLTRSTKFFKYWLWLYGLYANNGGASPNPKPPKNITPALRQQRGSIPKSQTS